MEEAAGYTSTTLVSPRGEHVHVTKQT
ncbi:uncharacterized protein G2W53_031545 [Senna tora]|uniref:Uncharacterized protein n=1 Tax=Senna tora TaxID=362788 RepID=A0A834TAS9_9FABA|nr:uncharacterized protein G2W53_031545 [Senna tora]